MLTTPLYDVWIRGINTENCIIVIIIHIIVVSECNKYNRMYIKLMFLLIAKILILKRFVQTKHGIRW